MTTPNPSPAAVDLRGLAELMEAATPGEWRVLEGDHVNGVTTDAHVICDCLEVLSGYTYRRKGGDANAALIVAMRNALPQLLARVQQLEEALKPFAVRFAQLDEAEMLTARINSNGATQARFFVGDFHRARAALRAKLSDPSPEAGGSNDAD